MLRFICVFVTVTSLGFCAVVDVKNGIYRKLESESISEVVVGDVKTNKTSLAEQSPNDKFARPIIIEPVVAEEENTPEPIEIVNKNDKFARPQFVKNSDVNPGIDPKYQPVLDPRSNPRSSDPKPDSTRNITSDVVTLRPPNDKFVSEEYLQSIYANKSEENPNAHQKSPLKDKEENVHLISEVESEMVSKGTKNPEEAKPCNENTKNHENTELKLPKNNVRNFTASLEVPADSVSSLQTQNIPISTEVPKTAASSEVVNTPVIPQVSTASHPQKVSEIHDSFMIVLNKPPNPSREENNPKLPNSSNFQKGPQNFIEFPNSTAGQNNLKLLNSSKKQNISKPPNSGNVQNTSNPSNEQNKSKPPNSSNHHSTSKPSNSSSLHSAQKPPNSSLLPNNPKPPKSPNFLSTPKPSNAQTSQSTSKPPPNQQSTPKPPNSSTKLPNTPTKIESNKNVPNPIGVEPIIAGVLPNDKFVTQEYIESIKNKVRQEITSEITKLHEDTPIQKYVDSLTSNFNIKSANVEDKPCENTCHDDVIYKPDDLKNLEGDEYVRFVNRKVEDPAKGRDADGDEDDGINFTFLKGANIPCSTTSGNTGTCLPLLLCKEMNGVNANNVQNNNGGCGPLSCCEISKGCRETMSAKVGYFKNPPVTGSSCRLSIKAFNQNVCQIRLDFEEFRLANPSQQAGAINSALSCRDDSMVIISPNGLTTPILCGSMKGQHMYVPINTTDGEMAVQLVMNLGPRPGLPEPKWKIKITQLECPVNPDVVTSAPVMKDDFVALAPHGCLQYFTEPQGTVCNFGYDPDTPNHFYIANHKYAICFKRRPNNCGIRFTAKYFEMSGRPNDCSGDYLFIPGAEMRSSGNTNIRSSYCEKMISPDSEIISMLPGPFNIQFITDNVGSIEERGWCLNYRTFSTGNCL